MADGVSFDIDGLEELQKKLQTLSKEAEPKIAAFALRKSADLVRDAAKGNYILQRLDDPDTPENIRENIVTRKAPKRATAPGDVKYRVGVLGGARDYSAYGELATGRSASGNPGGDTFYWRFLEFGTQNIRARPFMRPALANNTEKATKRFVKEFDAALTRALKKAAKADKKSF